MRVTSRQIVDSIITNILRNKQKLNRAQEIVATQKIVAKPSDDPVAMGRILGYRKTLSAIDQYDRNVTRGKTHIEVTESTLNEIYDYLLEARQLAVDQSSGAFAERSMIAEQMKNIYDQVLQLANTKLGNSYIFSGHKTDAAPFSRDADYNATYDGDDGDIRVIAGKGVEVKVNVTGEDAFGGAMPVFDVLRDLIHGLENPETATGTTEIAAQVAPLTNSLNQIETVRAAAASTFTRLQSTETQLADFKVKVENMLSGEEDADISKAIIELQSQQAAYETSLAAASRILQSSILDFLR
jgi:flagellar hook-associated protein 3 FlgL